jgi:NADH:ubiquinone oxidoreductase subunit 6 (subunit J)
MARVNIKAVLLGFGAVLLLDTLVGFVLFAVLGTDGTAEQAVREAISNPAFLLSGVVLGSLTTVAGGYLAARIAKSYPYFNALALGLLGAAYGLLFWSQYPLWFNILGLVLVVPAALLGAHLLVLGSRTRA